MFSFGKWHTSKEVNERSVTQVVGVSSIVFRNCKKHITFSQQLNSSHFVLPFVDEIPNDLPLISERIINVSIPMETGVFKRTRISEIGIQMRGCILRETGKFYIEKPKLSFIDVDLSGHQLVEFLEAMTGYLKPTEFTLRCIVAAASSGLELSVDEALQNTDPLITAVIWDPKRADQDPGLYLFGNEHNEQVELAMARFIKRNNGRCPVMIGSPDMASLEKFTSINDEKVIGHFTDVRKEGNVFLGELVKSKGTLAAALLDKPLQSEFGLRTLCRYVLNTNTGEMEKQLVEILSIGLIAPPNEKGN